MGDIPDDIPQDLLQVGEDIAAELPTRIRKLNRVFAARVIARAILAERERAAATIRKGPKS